MVCLRIERNNKMMQQSEYTILSTRMVNRHVAAIEIQGPAGAITAPGQFVNILLDGKYLRRPISVADYDASGRISLLIDIVGEGTRMLADMEAGTRLDVLTGLGNGFSTDILSDRPVLISGGIGIAPLIGLARRLRAEGKHPVAVAGFNSGADAFGVELFREIGVECKVAVMQGDLPGAVKGNAIDAALSLYGEPEYFYSCGPLPMMRALCERLHCDGQLSLDARMGCGFGACMCCSVHTHHGPRRICKEGPVFTKNELVWNS